MALTMPARPTSVPRSSTASCSPCSSSSPHSKAQIPTVSTAISSGASRGGGGSPSSAPQLRHRGRCDVTRFGPAFAVVRSESERGRVAPPDSYGKWPA